MGTLLIETATAPTAMAGTIRKAIHDTDPDAFVASLVSLRQHMQLSLLPYRIAARPDRNHRHLGDISGWRWAVRARFL